MKGNIWQVAVLAIALALVLPAINVAFADAADEFSTSETTPVDYDTDYTLDRDDVFAYTDLTVTANGSTLVEGTDFEFFNESATIDWIDTSKTSDGDTATVDYSFLNHSQQTKDQRDILGTAAVWLGYLLLIAAMGALFVLIAGGGGF